MPLWSKACAYNKTGTCVITSLGFDLDPGICLRLLKKLGHAPKNIYTGRLGGHRTEQFTD